VERQRLQEELQSERKEYAEFIDALRRGELDSVIGIGKASILRILDIKTVEEKERLLSELSLANEELVRSEQELALRNQVAEVFLTVPDDELYNEVMKVVLEALDSQHGVFGYIDEHGALVVPSETHHHSDEHQVADKVGTFPRETWEGHSWLRALREKRAIYSNEPPTDTSAGPLPFCRQISLPILHQDEAIGLLLVGNRERNYDEQDVQLLQSITRQIAPILTARLHRERVERARKRLEGQLLQAQKMESIGQLAAGVAHEINTPMQSVGDNTRFVRDSINDLLKLTDQYAALLASVKDGDVQPKQIAEIGSAIEDLDLEFIKEEIPKAIEQTLSGVDRVAEIVEAMKDFSHPGRTGKTPTDLNKAIASTIIVCRNRWKYVADLETDLQDDLPMVSCLVAEFNQVIVNIVVNAADAIGRIVGDGGEGRGLITVSTREDGEFVEVRVSDTGSGIPEKIRHKVFEPFFTTKEVGQGTGQGLAISRDVIVNKHGGTIDLDSQPGIGTTFIIRLPIAAEPAIENKGAA